MKNTTSKILKSLKIKNTFLNSSIAQLLNCFPRRRQVGFTLVETLITVSLLAILSGGALMGYRGQINKANDGKRKDDLAKLKVVMEDYYSDHNCYPQSVPDCGENFEPYLTQMPCEPGGRQSYRYVPGNGSCPQDYRFYTKLNNTSDPAIVNVGCLGGCGPNQVYNWGVSSTNVKVGEVFPSASPACEVYFSCMAAECNSIPDPEKCSRAYFCDSNCDGGCVDEFGEAIPEKQCN